MSLLEMKNVSFIDNTTQVISDTSLSIEKGSVTALLGESGGGKSTVLKLLAGIVIPTKGNIFYNGKELSKMSKKENLDFRKNSAFMFQNSALWANQNIYQNMELPLKIHFPQMSEEEIDVKIKETLKKVQYEKELTLRPASLSIGEQKKIAFARALICDPQILFLDEPTDSLDKETRKNFISILQEFCYNGNTLIYVSHDITFVNLFQNNKYYFEKGTVIDRILLNDLQQESYDEI